MRTTITLDPDVADLVKRKMRASGIGFKRVVNDALREALGEPVDEGYELPPPVHGGRLRLDINRTGALLAELDAEEYLTKYGDQDAREAG